LKSCIQGWEFLKVSSKEITAFYTDRRLAFERPDLYPNQFVILRDQLNPSHSAVGRDGFTSRSNPSYY
jgi:hypothetical protein